MTALYNRSLQQVSDSTHDTVGPQSAYIIPSAGVAASIGSSSTRVGLAYTSAFGANPNEGNPLYGGRPTASRGGGGGARGRVFLANELQGALDEYGDPVEFAHLQYTMKSYGNKDTIKRPLPDGNVVCALPFRQVIEKCQSNELKELCSMHGISLPRRPVRDTLLSLLHAHECTPRDRKGCEDWYAVLAPVLTMGRGVLGIESSVVDDDFLTQVQDGFHVEAVYKDAHQVVDGEERPVVQLPLQLLVHHLTVAGLDALAAHHGMVLPGRGSGLKKAEVKGLLLKHRCDGCTPLYFLLNPIKWKGTRTKPQVSKSPPAWVKEIDAKERPEFQWEAFVDINREEWPPRATTMRDIAAAMQGFCADLDPKVVEEEGCKVCGQLTRRCDISANCGTETDFAPLIEDGVCATERRSEHDPEGYVADTPVLASGVEAVCEGCMNALRKKTRPKAALANGLWLGEVPNVLKDLTLAEQALISRVRYNRCVVRVSSGHAKMIANVISFEHPSMKIYERLPFPKEELDEVLAVVFTGVVKPNEDEIKRTPVLVRRNRVKQVLEWLKLNHRNYNDLKIDYQALESYPLEDVPVGVWHKPATEEDGNVLSTAKSLFDDEDELGTSEGPCPFTVHGLTTEKFSTMTSIERKLVAAQHLKNGGAFLAVGHAADPQCRTSTSLTQ